MHVRHSAFALAVLAVLSASHAAPRMQSEPTPPYTIRNLGSLGAASTALDISDVQGAGEGDFFGFVVGYSRTPQGSDHAFAYDASGVLRDLGTLGGDVSVATATNAWGRVVGRSTNSDGVMRAFLRSPFGEIQDLGSLSGAGESFATAINFNDVVVGGSQTTASPDSTQAFIYRNGVMSPLGVTLGGTKSVANDINVFGDVVGYAYIAGNTSYRAFLFRDGETIDLGSLGGRSEALAINSRRRIVGRSRLRSVATQHAFLYVDGAMRDLGTLGGANSTAFDINDSDVVVGSSEIAAGSSLTHAVMWRNGVITDLNTLLPEGSGWVLHSATGINHAEQIVGYGLLNGRRRAFLLTPPLDIQIASQGFEDLASNLPRPVQAGRMVTWVYFVTAANEVPGTATNITVTDTLEGPVEYVNVRVFRGDATCEIQERRMVCQVPRISGDGFGAFFVTQVRTTGPGAFGHTARITHVDEGDPNPANNMESESNTAISLAGIALNPPVIAGGRPVEVRLTLTDPHPNGGSVRLTSSNPSVAAVRSSFVVIDSTRSFNLVPAVVSEPTTVEITATYGLVTKSATLTVMPPAISALQLTPTTVVGGCGTVAAKVSVTGAAPASGASISINETIPAAQFPASLVVPAGALSHVFIIPTSYVTDYQSGTVTASFGGVSKAVTLNVRAIRAESLALTPNPVAGGGTVNGVVTLECPSPTPVTVMLSSGTSSVAAPTVSAVVIPAGETSAPFAVRTMPVAAATSVSIRATVFGTRKTATLVVTPSLRSLTH